MRLTLNLIILFFLSNNILLAQNKTNSNSQKEQSILDYRTYFSSNQYRGHSLRTKKNLKECLSLLNDEGQFTDLKKEVNVMLEDNWTKSINTKKQAIAGKFLTEAFNRLWRISESFRSKEINANNLSSTHKKLIKGFIFYANLERRRPDTNGRFHSSCFAIPTAAVNSYFALLNLMDKIENEKINNPLLSEFNRKIKLIAYQSWTKPVRNDETDNNIVSISRFRNHVWWVGGNALGYRSLLPTAIMMKSKEMVNVLQTVAVNALSNVSQNTYETAFWTEGFTADGAGWGHGKQSLVWGYPIDGTANALNILKLLKNSPWQTKLSQKNLAPIFNYLRGSSWYYFKGYELPCLGRMNFKYEKNKKKIKSNLLIKSLLNDFKDDLSTNQILELKAFKKEAKNHQITMKDFQDKSYSGSRWFFNNDDLIQKTNGHYTIVNMASIRCDGNESAYTMHDKFNYFTNDGLTYFVKKGNEYQEAMGAWNLTAIPGVTSRQGEDNLVPVTNWRGYVSKYNFAAAATSGTKNAAAGFIYEKINASAKDGVNDKTGLKNDIDFIYNVQAHKSYFFLGDYMLALGAGINNKTPEINGDIWTTIDQTLWDNTITWGGSKQSGEINLIDKDKSISLENCKDNTIWVSQENGFSYGILPNQTTGKIELKAEHRITKWEDLNLINKKNKNLSKNADILQLAINHGKNVQNGTYGYLVYYGDKSAKKAFKKSNIEVLSNTTKLQAAATTSKSLIGAVFYDVSEKLKIDKNFEISVSAPSSILLEKFDNYYLLTVTDAEMNKNLTSMTIKTSLNVRGENVTKENNIYLIKIEMPSGELLGKPKTIKLIY